MKKSKTAFMPADILLPAFGTDMQKWAVIACDQFTSQPEYWETVKNKVGQAPSAMSLILPEAYLDSPNADEMIDNIHRTMEDYLKSGMFREYKDSFIYLERTDSTGNVRSGIVGMVDLEWYDFSKGSVSEVRATEATVAERIPPRLKVRSGAPLELPHIMLLIDDPEKTVIEPLARRTDEFSPLYDFELMQGGGRAKGYLMSAAAAEDTDNALAALGSREEFEKRSGVKGAPVLLYAMGDGNHSLATAKEYYEQLKRRYPERDLSAHPARYALAEVVNLHSEALKFEAIHRIISGTDPEKLIRKMTDALGLTGEQDGNTQSLVLISGGSERRLWISKPCANLAVGSVQSFLDGYLAENGGSIDYIHGEDVVRRLASDIGCVGVILPDMAKEELFPTVIKDGALPRKTFSMGHAEDKRYYIEARRISEN